MSQGLYRGSAGVTMSSRKNDMHVATVVARHTTDPEGPLPDYKGSEIPNPEQIWLFILSRPSRYGSEFPPQRLQMPLFS